MHQILIQVRLVDVHPAAGCCAPWGQQEPGTYHWCWPTRSCSTSQCPGRGRLGLYWLPVDALSTAANA